MKTKSLRKGAVALTAAATLLPATASLAQEAPKLQIGGTTYTKWLYGNTRQQGAMYNFTTIPGEGSGDNGIGTELELLLNARLSSAVEVRGRIHSRFSQNFWSNFGGFGGNPSGPCINGDCGEFDARSNQYIKLRGLAVTLTPGYLVDSATIGANDFGQFDPYVVGRIRYIDRDNAYGVLVQGSALDRKLTYDVAGISLPRLWAGPNYKTGAFHTTDASYVFQTKYTFNDMFDVGGIFQYAIDNELETGDTNVDNGRNLFPRFRNGVGGVKAGFHMGSVLDVRGSFYRSYMHAEDTNYFGTDGNDPRWVPKSFGINGYSPVPAGRHEDNTWKVDLTLNDPLEIGLSLNAQAFSIGADYVAVMAARRESDVLLTEGHDASFAFPGPNNAKYGVFAGNPSAIGYGGWTSETQQVATLNVDNEFTDFDEPMAETAIGWKGLTFNPVYSNGALDLAGEYSFITYNTNWQAWGDDNRSITDTQYPGAELDSGVLHNFRSAYQPFQEKQTQILALKARYVLDFGRGIDVFGKVKYIHDTDKRLNDKKYLPYQDGDCPGGDVACAGNRRNYGTDANGNPLSTADFYGNPGLVTRDGVSGYQFKPFDDISDDDRVLNYTSFNLGAGYQLTDDLYASLSYTKFMADLQDGNTAFQSYNLHQMVSGKHDKNLVSLKAKYILAGVEFGLEGQYLFGSYTPEYGTGYLAQQADEKIASDHGVAVGSLGFTNRYNGWNPLDTRSFEHVRLKAFMKAQF
ncbi:hypothetical protein ACN28I_35485 [Archangium gephyra]|uniref:hypothetical protein n=1 Tax=Archangium gephyra TaxID=48 RepID=UPI003B7C7BD7